MMLELMGLNLPRKLKPEAVPSLNLPKDQPTASAALKRKQRMQKKDNDEKKIKLIAEQVK